MDKVRNHILWLEKLYGLEVIDKDTYIYELYKLGCVEGYMSKALERKIENKMNEES